MTRHAAERGYLRHFRDTRYRLTSMTRWLFSSIVLLRDDIRSAYYRTAAYYIIYIANFQTIFSQKKRPPHFRR